MVEWIDSRSRFWAIAAVVVGVALLLGRELIEEPDITLTHLLLELFDIIPIVLTSVGVVLLSQGVKRQRDEQIQIIHDLEIARACRASAGAPSRAHC